MAAGARKRRRPAAAPAPAMSASHFPTGVQGHQTAGGIGVACMVVVLLVTVIRNTARLYQEERLPQ